MKALFLAKGMRPLNVVQVSVNFKYKFEKYTDIHDVIQVKLLTPFKVSFLFILKVLGSDS
jgi:hypothetical protein